jgi:hypothetical protein
MDHVCGHSLGLSLQVKVLDMLTICLTLEKLVDFFFNVDLTFHILNSNV